MQHKPTTGESFNICGTTVPTAKYPEVREILRQKLQTLSQLQYICCILVLSDCSRAPRKMCTVYEIGSV